MYNGQSACLQEILESMSRRVPKIVLQRVEKSFPTLKKFLVSVLCQCVQKIILPSCLLDLDL